MDSLVQKKLKILFEKLAEPDYILNNYYTDSLLTKLSSNNDPETMDLDKRHILTDLLPNVLKNLENAAITVKVFILKIMAMEIKDEVKFTHLFQHCDKFIAKSFSQLNSSEMKPSLKVGMMDVALSLLMHNAGITWLLSTEAWRSIITLPTDKQTVFVVRKMYNFCGQFMWKLDERQDEENICNVAKIITAPLGRHDYFNLKEMSSEEEVEHIRELEPLVHMMLALFQDASRIRQKTPLMSILLENFKFVGQIYILVHLMHNHNILMLFGRLIFWLSCAKSFLAKPMSEGTVFDHSDFLEVEVGYYNMAQCLLKLRSPIMVIDFTNACDMIWTDIWRGVESPPASSNSTIASEHDQMVVVRLVPLIHLVDKSRLGDMESVYKAFFAKILGKATESTVRLAFSFRNLLSEMDALPAALHSVKTLCGIKNNLRNEQANIIFQTLFYVLRKYDPSNDPEEFQEDYEDCESKVQVMTYVMDMVHSLLQKYTIRWKESLEVLSLYTCVHNILEKRQNLSCKFVVSALSVVTLSVRQFLPPSLSLLLAAPGAPGAALGPLLRRLLHHRHWEVRDSALEALAVCTDIAFVKYPPFQEQIIENGLLEIAATLARHEPESYAQASALKCIGASTRVNALWDRLRVSHPTLQEDLISILQSSQEGIVRKEAVNVLCQMYQHITLSSDTKSIFYENMVSSALLDFHWEVQIAALHFWRVAIQSHFTHHGMLDGKFPAVTFSKESRKIVTLNEDEIRKRLVKILEDLSSIGCLTVLTKLLQEDGDIDVMNVALDVSNELISVLSEHNAVDVFRQENFDPNSLKDVLNESEDKTPQSVDNDEKVTSDPDAVIEGILNSNDLNLLANMYERKMKMETEEETFKVASKLNKLVSPSQFVNYLLCKDFKAYIEDNRRWNDGIRSLSSLLDDVLGIYEVINEANSMDCY